MDLDAEGSIWERTRTLSGGPHALAGWQPRHQSNDIRPRWVQQPGGGPWSAPANGVHKLNCCRIPGSQIVDPSVEVSSLDRGVQVGARNREAVGARDLDGAQHEPQLHGVADGATDNYARFDRHSALAPRQAWVNRSCDEDCLRLGLLV